MDHAAADGGRLVVADPDRYRRTQTTNQARTVLDEDEYTSTLSHIVTRDYFPSLPSLRRDAAILDARSRGDISGAVAVRRAARREEMRRERELEEENEEERRANEVGETAIVPHRGGTVDATIKVRKRPRPLKHETVTGFHARVTSEDNAEFDSNQERERKEREERLGVVYAARADKGGRLMIEAAINGGDERDGAPASGDKLTAAQRALCDTPLGLSSDLYDAPPSAGLRITGGDADEMNNSKRNNGIGRNGLFFQPLHRYDDRRTITAGSGKLLTGAPSSGGTFLALENKAATSSDVAEKREEGTDPKADNLLMPPPPARMPGASSSNNSVVVPFQQSNDQSSASDASAKSAEPSIDQRCQLVEYLPKPELPDIHPPATRFPYQLESRLLANPSGSGILPPDRNGGNAGYTSASDATDLDAPPRPLDRERDAHKRARKREHETFVAMTPLIHPGSGGGKGGEADEPIMTWGDVASTPLVLGGGSAVDGRSSSADWEPARPATMSVGNDADSESSSLPSFDVVDETGREGMARRAERGLSERARTYKAAGSVQHVIRREADDDSSVRSSRSMSSVSTANTLDRKASLTPAARALLEASNAAHKSKKMSRGAGLSSKSRIFQTSSSTPRSCSAASRDSFGSALRMSYTPNATPRGISREGRRKRKGSASSSALRRAAGGATPRATKLR